MPRQEERIASVAASAPHEKTPIHEMTHDRRREVVAQLTDDVLAKLTSAFFEVVSQEKWTKRDLALISGLNETAIGHILAGRRKNLTVETIALLVRSMQKRPELVLHDTRPKGNKAYLPSSAATALVHGASQTSTHGLSAQRAWITSQHQHTNSVLQALMSTEEQGPAQELEP
jgi:hypothetical protein